MSDLVDIADAVVAQARDDEQLEAYVGRSTDTQVRVYLKEVEPVRVKVDPNVGPALGSPQAPVTIVEFSDFQCPFCRGVVPTLKQQHRHVLAYLTEACQAAYTRTPAPSLLPPHAARHRQLPAVA